MRRMEDKRHSEDKQLQKCGNVWQGVLEDCHKSNHLTRHLFLLLLLSLILVPCVLLPKDTPFTDSCHPCLFFLYKWYACRLSIVSLPALHSLGW